MSKPLAIFSVVAALALVQSNAIAAPCGVFVDRETGFRLVLESDGTAREYARNGTVSAALHHYKKDSTVFTRNAETGYAIAYRLSADGTELALLDNKWGSKPYVGQEAYTCTASSELQYLERGSCDYGKEEACCVAGDKVACVGVALETGNVAELQRMCQTRADACLALMEAYERAANPREGAAFNMYAEKKPLPAAQLQELAAMCQRFQTPELCQKALTQVWHGRQFALGRQMLGQMCQAKLEEKACERAEALGRITLPENPAAATELPCGEYANAVSSLTGDLTFGDKGTVKLALGSVLRARIEDGMIKVRHDKGGDFVFIPVATDTLLGLDTWNQYGVYRRNAAPKKACLPPVVFKEQPLSTACGLEQDPAQCCKAGDTQGCNRLGSMAALKGDWRTAAQMYAKVCAKSVRVGCENWAYTIGKTGDAKGVEKGMTQLCRKDDRHVACDVLETTNLPMLMMGYELEKMEKGAKKR